MTSIITTIKNCFEPVEHLVSYLYLPIDSLIWFGSTEKKTIFIYYIRHSILSHFVYIFPLSMHCIWERSIKIETKDLEFILSFFV